MQKGYVYCTKCTLQRSGGCRAIFHKPPVCSDEQTVILLSDGAGNEIEIETPKIEVVDVEETTPGAVKCKPDEPIEVVIDYTYEQNPTKD